MKNSKYLLILATPVLVLASPIYAETKVLKEDITQCKSFTNRDARLNCYDELFETLSLDQAQTTVAAKKPETQKPKAKMQKNASPELGSEFIKPVSPDFIEAKLLDEFTGWTGKTVFRLDNGHVWRQINNNVRDYRQKKPIANARIRISKGAFGSYNLRVENIKRIIQVKRIK